MAGTQISMVLTVLLLQIRGVDVALLRAAKAPRLHSRCLHDGCGRWASYGAPTVPRNRTFCALHAAPHHVYLIGIRCGHGNGTALACTKRATYGFLDQRPSTVRCCKAHREAGMVHLLSRKCRAKGCPKQPIFGAANTTRPLFCRQHKEQAHVDVVNRRCQKCNRQGVFGDPQSSAGAPSGGRSRGSRARALFCAEHRLDSHTNLISKQCLADGCAKQPYFGDRIARVPLYCKKHKADDHEDVKNRRCYHPHGCTRHPAYGDPRSGVPSFCHAHKAPSDILLLATGAKPSRRRGVSLYRHGALQKPLQHDDSGGAVSRDDATVGKHMAEQCGSVEVDGGRAEEERRGGGLRFAYEPSVFRETALGGADGGAARAASEASRQQTCTGRNARVKSTVVAQMPGGGNSASGLVPVGSVGAAGSAAGAALQRRFACSAPLASQALV